MFDWAEGLFGGFVICALIIGVVFGYSVMTAAMQDVRVVPKGFVCTESAIVNGAAECVKYEKRERSDETI